MGEYIIDFKPVIRTPDELELMQNLEFKIIKKQILTKEEIEIFLSSLMYIVREKLDKEMETFANKCDIAQSMIVYYLRELGVSVIPCTSHQISKKTLIHDFVIAKFNEDNDLSESYLLDPTYIQFFTKSRCNINNLFVCENIISTPDPGYFIDDCDKDYIEHFLNNGYTLLDEKSARIYGDSFLNAEYRANFNNYEKKTISGEIYIDLFSNGKTKLSKTYDNLVEEGLNIDFTKS